MGYYNNIIGQGLANTLAAAGMELRPLPPTFDYELNYEPPTYAVVFDWFIDNGVDIAIERLIDDKPNYYAVVKVAKRDKVFVETEAPEKALGWHYAANAAIEKAIEMLKSLKK